MRYRYRQLDLDLIRQLLAGEQLRRLFQELLLRTAGDVGEAFRWMRQLQRRGLIGADLDLDQLLEELIDQGMISADHGGELALAGPGERMLRRAALDEVFGALSLSTDGDHSVAASGSGRENLTESRPWTFGDPPEAIVASRSVENSIRRLGPERFHLEEEDLEVHETEQASNCATVIAIDISHSMILYGEDRFTPAKKLALALVELVRRRYRKDTLDVVLFGDEARRVPLGNLSAATVGPFHTNTRAGLDLAATLLCRRRNTNRQIVLVTDGKPSCITENGRLYKNPFGLDLKIVNRTLDAADRCRRDGITITTFMLASDPALVDFVEQLTRINRGRAFYASPDNLAEFVLADYVRNRRRRVR